MPLFERKKRQMIPTVAGRIYLATAHQMIDMKEETYKIIHDIADETVGEIALAYTPELRFHDVFRPLSGVPQTLPGHHLPHS